MSNPVGGRPRANEVSSGHDWIGGCKMEKTLGTIVEEYIDQITNNKYSKKFNKKAVINLFTGDKKRKI